MPAVVRNPPLMNALMGVLEDNSTAADKPEPLTSNSSSDTSIFRRSPAAESLREGHSGYSTPGQINDYRQNVKEFTLENLGKLFMAEALQDHSS
ncbi:hypothetical protein SRHO_G00283560 [Serrasalmus rhombeus]